MPLSSLKRLRRQANFVYEMTKTSIKLQNEHSYLGLFWYLLGPALLFSILLFVFSGRLGLSIERYPLYLLLGIISWDFFSAATGRAMGVFVQNAGIIKALPVPLNMLVISTVMHSLLSHAAELALFVAVAAYFDVIPHLLFIVLFLPVLLLGFLFALGMSFAVASLYVFMRDLNQIWSVLTRAWWFATPIFYAPTATGLGAKVSLWNPLYYIMHISRELLIYERIPAFWLYQNLTLFACGSLVVGYAMFHHFRPRFAEYL